VHVLRGVVAEHELRLGIDVDELSRLVVHAVEVEDSGDEAPALWPRLLEAAGREDLGEGHEVPAVDEEVEVVVPGGGQVQRVVALPMAVGHPRCPEPGAQVDDERERRRDALALGGGRPPG
jgi:hypothetical protein